MTDCTLQDAINIVQQRFIVRESTEIELSDEYFEKADKAIEIVIKTAKRTESLEEQLEANAAHIGDLLDVQKRNEALEKAIAVAAICILRPNDGICDTIWIDKFGTLYEHLVSQLDVELTGDIDHDIAEIAKIMEAK